MIPITVRGTAEPVERKRIELGQWYTNFVGTPLKVVEINGHNVKMFNPYANHSTWYSKKDIAENMYQSREQMLDEFSELVTKQTKGL